MSTIRIWSAVSHDDGATVACEVLDVEDSDDAPVMDTTLHPTRRPFYCHVLRLTVGEGDCGCRPGRACVRHQIETVEWWPEAARRDATVHWYACGPDRGKRHPEVGERKLGRVSAERDARKRGWTRIVGITRLGRWLEPVELDPGQATMFQANP